MNTQPLSTQLLGKKPLLAILASVYTIQSLIGMFALQGVPAVLRSEGVSTTYIGLFYVAMLPWAFKFLWAPIIEQQRKKSHRLYHHGWLIMSAQCLMILVLVILSFSSVDNIVLIFIGIMILTLASTCADITADGLAVDELPANKRHLGNMMQVGGGYVGAIFGGGLFIYLSSKINWQYSLFALAIIMFVMSLASLNLFGQKTLQHPKKEAFKPSLRAALANSKVRMGLLLVAISQLGTRSVLSMMMPFLYDQGVNLEDLGILTAGGGVIAGLLGVLLGGSIVKQSSAFKALLACLTLEILIFCALFLYGAQLLTIEWGVSALFIINSVVVATKFVALYTMMMQLAHGDQSGVDFSLFQSMDMLIAIMMAIISGMIIAKFGYSYHYILAILTTCIAIFVLLKMSSKKLIT